MNLSNVKQWIGACVAVLLASPSAVACADQSASGNLEIPTTGFGADWISYDPPDPERIDTAGLNAEFRSPTISAPSQYGAVTMIGDCVLLLGQYDDPSYYDVAIKPNDGHQRGGNIPEATKEQVNYLIERPPNYC